MGEFSPSDFIEQKITRLRKTLAKQREKMEAHRIEQEKHRLAELHDMAMVDGALDELQEWIESLKREKANG